VSPRTQAVRTSIPKRLLASSANGQVDPGGPRVSVVIPTYNRAAIVVRAIESVLRQTFRDLELIVVDDCSADGTADAVAQIGDPRVQYVRLAKNGGQWHAENIGIARARGEWVAFVDSDDEWLPHKLEKQLARVDQEPDPRVSAVYCRAQVHDQDGLRPVREGLAPEGDVTASLLAGGQTMTPTVYMVKRSALLEVGGFDESLAGAQDWDLWLRLALAAHRFAVVQEPLVIYHIDNPDRKTDDPVVAVVSYFALLGRWGPLMRESRGAEAYERWTDRRKRPFTKPHRKLLRKLMRRGSRADALRYVRNMRRALPWSRPYVTKALAVVLFGRLPYRLLKALGRWRRAEAAP
jgi:glycosyltransferase involved in cell wall biosynthesis